MLHYHCHHPVRECQYPADQGSIGIKVLTTRGEKIYVTHSGPTADKVSVYSASKEDPLPVLLDEVSVGLNPFGLAFVP